MCFLFNRNSDLHFFPQNFKYMNTDLGSSDLSYILLSPNQLLSFSNLLNCSEKWTKSKMVRQSKFEVTIEWFSFGTYRVDNCVKTVTCGQFVVVDMRDEGLQDYMKIRTS